MFDFYYLGPSDEINTWELPEGYFSMLWRPKGLQIVPKGVCLWPSVMWWLFHRLHIFHNTDYSMMLIYRDRRLVHRSVIFPRFFRFPFMQPDDLQIGDTWTSPEHRGKGLAKFALATVVRTLRRPIRGFWYIVHEKNIPSIRVVESVGFRKVARGRKVARFGLLYFGYYAIQQTLDDF